jgi:hypothetical protein
MLTTEVSDLVMKKQVGGQYIMSAYTNWIDLGSAIGPLIVYSLLNNISFNLIFLSSALLLLLYAILRNLIK